MLITPNKTICIVEDNDMDALLLDMQLSEYYKSDIHTYHSAEDLIIDLPNVHPAVIILDFFLPGMNGYQALIKLKQLLPNTTVILHSSQKDIQSVIKLFKAGAFDYISKGADHVERLIQSIDSVFKNSLN